MDTNIDEVVSPKNPLRFMTIIYIASLALIAVLSIITHLVLGEVIDEQSQTGALVNKSGQQRMLSQRTSMFAVEYLKTGSEFAKTLAKSSLAKMQHNHNDLLKEHYDAIEKGYESPLSSEMLTLYFEGPSQVSQQLDTFSRLITEALQHPPSASNSGKHFEKIFFEMATDPFLSSLNAVVSQYEEESLARVERLKFAQHVVLIVVILTILLEALFVFRPMVARIRQFAARLQYEASHDYLSGIYNRRSFFMIAEKILHTSHRHESSCSVVLIDIDKFKSINDNYGHDIGDLVIQELAELLQKSLRKGDVLARFGGEEFVILFPETPLHHAIMKTDTIRRAAEKKTFTRNGVSVSATFSAGVAECGANESLDASIKIADERLFKAKNNGRNLVCGKS